MKAVRARITGVVQGVGFRAWVERKAQALGLDGWVRNRRDGSVEAVLAGEATKVDEMLTMCWRGPSGSQVDGVSVDGAEAPGAGFEVKRTE